MCKSLKLLSFLGGVDITPPFWYNKVYEKRD
jgi:hypothetical protein